MPGRSFTIPVYDGARRFDIVGEILPRNNPADGTLRAELTLRPIAGFRGETSEDGDPDDAPRKVELTVTDDATTTPVDHGTGLLHAAGDPLRRTLPQRFVLLEIAWPAILRFRPAVARAPTWPFP